MRPSLNDCRHSDASYCNQSSVPNTLRQPTSQQRWCIHSAGNHLKATANAPQSHPTTNAPFLFLAGFLTSLRTQSADFKVYRLHSRLGFAFFSCRWKFHSQSWRARHLTFFTYIAGILFTASSHRPPKLFPHILHTEQQRTERKREKGEIHSSFSTICSLFSAQVAALNPPTSL